MNRRIVTNQRTAGNRREELVGSVFTGRSRVAAGDSAIIRGTERHNLPGRISTIRFLWMVPAVIFLTGCGNDVPPSDAYGTFESTEVIISAETAGRLVLFDAQEGDRIEKGQILGWVDTLGLSLEVAQLKAQRLAVLARLESNRAQADVHREQLKVARNELQRVRRLHDDGAATDRQLDEAEGNAGILERQIRSVEAQQSGIRSEAQVIEAQMARLRDRIERSAVRSPLSGTVLARHAEPGEMVSPGKALCKVADLDTMYLRAWISGGQLGQLRIGQQVRVLFDGPDGKLEQLTGEVSWIASRGEFTGERGVCRPHPCSE
jgi:HlyD family secretion protein